MKEDAFFTLNAFFKENQPLFTISGVFLLLGTTITTLLINDSKEHLLPVESVNLLQSIVVLSSLVFLLISVIIIGNGISTRRNEYNLAVFRVFNQKYSVKFGDLERLIFYSLYVPLLCIYYLYLRSYFVIFVQITTYVYLTVVIGAVIIAVLAWRLKIKLNKNHQILESLERDLVDLVTECSKLNARINDIENQMMIEHPISAENIQKLLICKNDLDLKIEKLASTEEQLSEIISLLEYGDLTKDNGSGGLLGKVRELKKSLMDDKIKIQNLEIQS